MLQTMKDMLASKKFLAALIAAIVWVAGRFGAELNSEELVPVVAPIWTYILGQGVADIGKLKAAS